MRSSCTRSTWTRTRSIGAPQWARHSRTCSAAGAPVGNKSFSAAGMPDERMSSSVDRQKASAVHPSGDAEIHSTARCSGRFDCSHDATRSILPKPWGARITVIGEFRSSRAKSRLRGGAHAAPRLGAGPVSPSGLSSLTWKPPPASVRTTPATSAGVGTSLHKPLLTIIANSAVRHLGCPRLPPGETCT